MAAMAASAAASLATSCAPALSIAPVGAGALVVTRTTPQDTAPKEDVRLVPSEAYLRTLLRLFGNVAPLEAQRRARGNDGAQLFDTWADYLAALGFPDHRNDLPRATQTNAIMVAAFERLGVALCDRAVEKDLQPRPPVPVGKRGIFAFELPATVDETTFAPRFDVLHRTFLGYPAALAPTARTSAFFHLYEDVVRRHTAAGAPRSRMRPEELGWAAVCQGLVRHPEFNLY